MTDLVRGMNGREFGYIVDFDGRSPVFVYRDDASNELFKSMEDHESVQVGEHFYTLRDLRRSLSCFISGEEYAHVANL